MIDLPEDRDRFAKPQRIKSVGIQRARRLRAEPTFTEKAPLPLEGEGAGGWGGGTALTGSPEDTDLHKAGGVNVSSDRHRGSTPTQPSPLQGEGS